MLREFGEMVYQFEQPFIVDGSRFEHTFGLSATPYHDGIGKRSIGYGRRNKGSSQQLENAERGAQNDEYRFFLHRSAFSVIYQPSACSMALMDAGTGVGAANCSTASPGSFNPWPVTTAT